MAGGELEENLADMLENHELRRCSGLPTGLLFSIDADRPGRLGILTPFVAVCGSAWPLAVSFEGASAGLPGLEGSPEACPGCEGAGVLDGGGD